MQRGFIVTLPHMHMMYIYHIQHFHFQILVLCLYSQHIKGNM